MPTPKTLKSGEKKYYRSNKLFLTKKILKLDDDKAVEFLRTLLGLFSLR